MRRTSISLIIIFSFVLVYAIINIAPQGHAVGAVPFKKGERFTYEVRYNGFKIGKSILTFNGEAGLGDKRAYHVTFFTKAPSLKDTEEIYADRDTFLPIEVHRRVRKKIGFNDNIIERYDQENFRVDISSKSRLRSKEFSIEKDSAIHNAILLIYYYRILKAFNESERFKVTLPTVDFEVMYSGTETIETPLGAHDAYVFTSEPPRFKFWLSADKRRIPLKIKAPGKLGYVLIIKSLN